LQISWLIVLFGAEISHAHQNVDQFEWEPDIQQMSAARQKLIALYICRYLIENFEKGGKAATAGIIASTLKLPIRLVERLVSDLADCGVLARIISANASQPAFAPARAIDGLTIQSILEALEQRGNSNYSPPQSLELDKISAALEAISGQIKRSAENRPLRDL
jgi:membrane protein